MSATTCKLSHLFVMLTFDWTKFFVFVLLRSYVGTEDTHGEKQARFLLFFKGERESEERKTAKTNQMVFQMEKKCLL